MGALTADDRVAGRTARAEVALDEIDCALALPRALIDASLNAGAALLGLAGRWVHAESSYFERLAASRSLGEVNAAQAEFVTTVVEDCGRQAAVLIDLARGGFAPPARPV